MASRQIYQRHGLLCPQRLTTTNTVQSTCQYLNLYHNTIPLSNHRAITMSSLAFAGATPLILQPTSSTSLCSRPSSYVRARAPVRMAIETLPPTRKTSVKKKSDEKVVFLTPFAEKINGRFAMLGLLAAIGPEILNPAHPTISAQLYAMVTFLPNLFLR